jgi:tRNA (guanosine-2'-O-)-methyltransferase
VKTDATDFTPILNLIPAEHEFFLLSENRQKKMLETAHRRIYDVRLVIQDVSDPHNVSACFRSAEAMGVMNVHTVDENRVYKTSSVSRGVDRWLNIHSHSSIDSCARQLKATGFRIAAGFPAKDALPIDQLPLDEPIALVFGNERSGVSETWLPHLDQKFTIPMQGMVESLNISVSAAISLYEVCRRRRASPVGQSAHQKTADTVIHWANQHFERLRLK